MEIYAQFCICFFKQSIREILVNWQLESKVYGLEAAASFMAALSHKATLTQQLKICIEAVCCKGSLVYSEKQNIA